MPLEWAARLRDEGRLRRPTSMPPRRAALRRQPREQAQREGRLQDGSTPKRMSGINHVWDVGGRYLGTCGELGRASRRELRND